jgi:phosphohistidine swiveling domain-containing protein
VPQIMEFQIDFFAQKQKRCSDRDIIAQQRFDREAIQATLDFFAAIQDDGALRRPAGLVVPNYGTPSISCDIKAVDVAGDAKASVGELPS